MNKGSILCVGVIAEAIKHGEDLVSFIAEKLKIENKTDFHKIQFRKYKAAGQRYRDYCPSKMISLDKSGKYNGFVTRDGSPININPMSVWWAWNLLDIVFEMPNGDKLGFMNSEATYYTEKLLKALGIEEI